MHGLFLLVQNAELFLRRSYRVPYLVFLLVKGTSSPRMIITRDRAKESSRMGQVSAQDAKWLCAQQAEAGAIGGRTAHSAFVFLRPLPKGLCPAKGAHSGR